VFLQIDFSNKLQVRYALGYQRGVDLFTGQSNYFELEHDPKSDKLPHFDMDGPAIRSKDRDKLIERLRVELAAGDVCIRSYHRLIYHYPSIIY
jgi:hypothetical protein